MGKGSFCPASFTEGLTGFNTSGKASKLKWLHVGCFFQWTPIKTPFVLPALGDLLLFLKKQRHGEKKAFPQQHCWHSHSFHYLHFSFIIAAAIMSPPSSRRGSPDTSVKCPGRDCRGMAFDRKGSSCSAADTDWGQRRAQSWGTSDIRPCALLLKTLLNLLFLWDCSPFIPDGLISPWGCSPVFAPLKHLCSDQLKGSRTEGDFLCVLAEELWVNTFLPGTGCPKLGSD